ncbi:MAG: hypothetical protein D6816_10775 [Bacteroidetes bacterium]|nr:MAG: hypothetical protein D6816_10775 [Bacteroidota bacterium]
MLHQIYTSIFYFKGKTVSNQLPTIVSSLAKRKVKHSKRLSVVASLGGKFLSLPTLLLCVLPFLL